MGLLQMEEEEVGDGMFMRTAVPALGVVDHSYTYFHRSLFISRWIFRYTEATRVH